jgi:hypothetical protein
MKSGAGPFPCDRDQRDLVAKSSLVIDGTAFEADDGTLFIFSAAQTRQEAEGRAAAAGPETRVFACSCVLEPAPKRIGPPWILRSGSADQPQRAPSKLSLLKIACLPIRITWVRHFPYKTNSFSPH